MTAVGATSTRPEQAWPSFSPRPTLAVQGRKIPYRYRENVIRQNSRSSSRVRSATAYCPRRNTIRARISGLLANTQPQQPALVAGGIGSHQVDAVGPPHGGRGYATRVTAAAGPAPAQPSSAAASLGLIVGAVAAAGPAPAQPSSAAASL